MRYPFDGIYVVTREFGECPGQYTRACRPDGSHNGRDYALPAGTPVLAAEDGTVTRADMDSSGYGIHIRIKNTLGGGTIYGHLSKTTVKAGQKVKAGEKIGYSGNTGNSTGPHLHFEVRTDINKCSSCVDPRTVLDGVSIETVPLVGQVDGHQVAWESLNVRLLPSMNGKVIGQMAAGDAVVFGCGEIVKADGHEWQEIRVYVAKEGLG